MASQCQLRAAHFERDFVGVPLVHGDPHGVRTRHPAVCSPRRQVEVHACQEDVGSRALAALELELAEYDAAVTGEAAGRLRERVVDRVAEERRRPGLVDREADRARVLRRRRDGPLTAGGRTVPGPGTMERGGAMVGVPPAG